LLKNYIAAGFDPAAFWGLTPREYAIHLEGAELREQRARSLVWWTAMMPHMKKPPSFEKFVGLQPKAPPPQSREVLQAMCDALAHAWGAKKVEH